MFKTIISLASLSSQIFAEDLDLSGSVSAASSLQYDLTIYKDDSYTTAYDSNSHQAFVVGKALYFQVDAATSISGLEFSLLSCKVTSGNDANLEYGIITDMCPDGAVNAQINGNTHDQDKIQAQYDVFEFIADAEQSDTNTIHINCEVVLCDANSVSDTTCTTGCQNSSRKRRNVFSTDKVLQLSATFKIEN
jgi:hypothetical protein